MIMRMTGGRRSPRRLAALVLLPLALGAPAVSAQAPIDASGYGPPDWVTPGTRVTGYAAGAAVSSSGYQLIEDPTGPYEDPTTGKRYRKTDETGESTGGASGDGFYEIDVVAVEGPDVVINYTLYTIDRTAGVLHAQPIGGWRQPGGVLDGVWANPDYLATLRTGDVGGLLVLQGPYELNGTTYDTVSIVNPTQGAYASSTFDRVSGVLVASTTRTAGQASPVRLPGQDPPRAADALGISRYVATRSLQVPGTGSAVPSWMTDPAGLRYQGVTVMTNPFDASLSVTWPTEATVTFSQVGATWAMYALRTITIVGELRNPGGYDGVVSGTGPFWWAPDALAGMTQGQLLDEDPVTGLRLVVGGRGMGPGGPTIDIDTQLPGTSGHLTYDLGTGVLMRYQVSTPSAGTAIDLTLAAMP